jgi:hypothetical protein
MKDLVFLPLAKGENPDNVGGGVFMRNLQSCHFICQSTLLRACGLLR